MVILVLMKLQIVGKKKFQKTEIVETFVGKVMMTNRSNIIVIRSRARLTHRWFISATSSTSSAKRQRVTDGRRRRRPAS
jgi:hypothetical protein